MSKVKIILNHDGIAELLNSAWAAGICQEAAASIAAKEEGLEIDAPHHTGQRVAVTVRTVTDEAAERNLEENAILKAMGG